MHSRSTNKSRRLRAKLTLSGYTYEGFAKLRGFNPRTVKAAVRGERSGPVAKQVVEAIGAL